VVIGKIISLNKKKKVMKALINALISAIAVIGLLLRFIKGSKAAVNTPRTIVIKYLG
tara:strand:+ start:1323 stop:1493 length:171 start_codon:yes stop_codon:yes gene_type:complete